MRDEAWKIFLLTVYGNASQEILSVPFIPTIMCHTTFLSATTEFISFAFHDSEAEQMLLRQRTIRCRMSARTRLTRFPIWILFHCRRMATYRSGIRRTCGRIGQVSATVLPRRRASSRAMRIACVDTVVADTHPRRKPGGSQGTSRGQAKQCA